MFERIRRTLGASKVRVSSAWTLSLVAYFVLIYIRLGSTPDGATNIERASRFSSNLHAILNSPVNAPYRFLQDLLLNINDSSLLLTRSASVVLGIIFLVSFYYCLRGWFGRHIAYLSTILLAFTPFFMLVSRSASPNVMYFMPAAVLASYLMVKKHETARWPLLLLAAVTSLSLYVPGMAWLLIPAIIYQFSAIKQALFDAELNKKYLAALILLVIILLSPMAIGLANHPSSGRQLLMIPDKLPSATAALKDWAWAGSSLFVQARTHRTLMIDRLPIFDVAQIGLIIFGGYVMWSRLRKQLLILVGVVLFILLLSGVGNNYEALGEVVILLSVIVGMGLRYLFIEWRSVFPINPLAKAFAIFLMSLLVIAHIAYGARYSLMAWPVTVAKASSVMLK